MSQTTKYVEGAVDENKDPRDIDCWLIEQGLKTWIDTRCAQEGALFEEISAGIRSCKVFVAFVSDEYKVNGVSIRRDMNALQSSTNCMRELHFAVDNLRKPLVLCPCGNSNEWHSSQIALLALNAPRVDASDRTALYECFVHLIVFTMHCSSAPSQSFFLSKILPRSNSLKSTPRHVQCQVG